MTTDGPERAEIDVLEAEIAALEARRSALLGDIAHARQQLAREGALAAAAAESAEQLDIEFGDDAARVKALEARVEETRREAATWGEVGDVARLDAAREAADCQGLLARLTTVASALADEPLRRWARREIAALRAAP